MKFIIKGDYFGGKFHKGVESKIHGADDTIVNHSPADLNLLLWECPINYGHIDKTLESAQKGFHLWKKTDTKERVNYVKRYQEQVINKKDELALAIALETGKPLWESHTEVNAVIQKADVVIKDSLPQITTKIIEDVLPKTDGIVSHRPIGPSLVVGPFNFPCHLANGQILNALLAGNSIIFKPSEKTCLSGQLLMECFHQAEFPLGVVNLLQGKGESVRRILKSKAIKGVFFTGSKESGLKILESTFRDLGKLVCLELGGKNTTIIHHDASVKHTLLELLKSCFLTTGQRCTSTSLVAIHEKIKDEFIEKFHDLAKKIIIDHPVDFSQDPFMGPLIDGQSLDTYLLYIGMAKREGMEQIMRGKKITKKHPGHYVTPSIHYTEKFNKKSHFLTSEIFAPSCTFIPYSEIESAIEMANSTEYGLASAVFTQNEEVSKTCLEEIDAGLININRSTVGASGRLPFGGVKNSGNYRPAAASTMESCIYPVSSLKIKEEDLTPLKGLKE